MKAQEKELKYDYSEEASTMFLTTWCDAYTKEEAFHKLEEFLGDIPGLENEKCTMSEPVPTSEKNSMVLYGYLMDSERKFKVKLFTDKNKNRLLEYECGGLTVHKVYIINNNTLQPVEKIISVGDKKYKRLYSAYGVNFSLEDSSYEIIFNLSIHFDKNSTDIIIDERERLLENYLFNLSSPIDIFKLNRDIQEILDIDVNIYPNYSLTVNSKSNEKENSGISYSYGEMQRIKTNQNGKDILITTDGFKYSDSNQIVTSDENGITITKITESEEELNDNEFYLYSAIKENIEKMRKKAEKDPYEGIRVKANQNRKQYKKRTPFKS